MLLAFSISPQTSNQPDGSVSQAVAAAVRVVRESGLPNETTSMFTTVEGEWEEVMAVVKRCVDAVAERTPRISLVMKADIRPGHTGQLTARSQGPQQTRHVLNAAHSPRRHVPGRRAQRPGPATGRDTRKHTTFEHMYSIAGFPAACTLRRASESLEQQRKPDGADLPGRRCAKTGRTSQPGLTPTPQTRPAEPANRFG